MTRSIRILCIALLMIVGLVGSTLPVPAQDRDDRNNRHSQCEKRVHQAEDRLRDAIQRHGEGSKQARKRHEQLEQARRNCPDMDRHNDRDHDHDQH